ncbi:hypothetical protein Desfe_0529 [Desulfurococcus amylolyticus DSM 16532]|uniref:Uncharacterized protein n=2 Tax=Desulfurococcus amylolyticus TaxID=94694 RepID=I3XR59_DESAM|nr:hypothetical protein Desfe_0529 [Desulfurococcus amylolyticus DSM 16532]
MNILSISHALGFGGAQLSTLEFFELLKDSIEIKVLVCDNATKSFVDGLSSLGLKVYRVHCVVKLGYPVMLLNSSVEKLVR